MRDIKKDIAVLFIAAVLSSGVAQADPIELPAPDLSGGVTLMTALRERAAGRDFSGAPLSSQDLSDLLWAAAGVNRENGGRTYPTALDRRDMTLYAFLADGVYRYLPEANAIELVVEGDKRSGTGRQEFVASASANLVFVQDMSGWTDADAGLRFGCVHAGEMAQNASLLAASKGWSAVVRGSFNASALAELIGLRENEAVRLTMSVGPKR